GREAVERAQEAYGHHAPDANRPFLTTREFFHIKWQVKEADRMAYAEEDSAGRRAFLDGLAEQPLTVEPTAITEPVAVETIGWFASAEELCVALAELDRAGAKDGMRPVRDALGTNPMVRLDTERWARFAAKGGSEPGVMAFAWLLERDDGEGFAFAITMLDEGRINAAAAVPVVEGALNLLAGEGTPD